ncbi:hypothetical protein B9Z19DRAFT_1069434 [Tuber borchii]|uniref:Uncharacterized protein n=1 Tax=Tuber borchii TaxID=42251 RepID=A0A2T6ZBJ9_TUBBO|nr:hypothetical protein B9Z19DRAFT_1069434 [Tuber borchii]
MSQRDSLDRLSATSSSDIDPTKPIRRGGSLKYLHEESPDQLDTAAFDLALLDYLDASPAQDTGYTTDSVDSYFYPNPNHPQPSAIQWQQPASSPQGWGHSPNQNVNIFAPPPPPPPTHDENQDIEANHSGPGRYVCVCGVTFGRPTDLERHRRTSRKHNEDPRGPACPFDSCSHLSRFVRVDNFKAHFMKQHGMSRYDVDAFIRKWRDQNMP